MQGSVKLQSQKRPAKVALFFGAGYTALHLAPHLRARGMTLYATVRSGQKNAFLRRRDIEPIKFTGELSPKLKRVMRRADIILSSAAPQRDGADPILSNMPRRFKTLAPKARWVGYLSATSVYGDRTGQWAFEDELLRPSTPRGRARVEAELAWLETGWPVHIFRLAGIYGPALTRAAKPDGKGRIITRNPLERLKAGRARAVIKPGHIVNRIHVEDICTALLASIDTPNPGQIYNIADGHPAAPQDVLDFGARLLGLAIPPRVDLNDPSVSDMARSFYNDNKRVDISRAHNELGFVPRFSDYRQGLISLAQSRAPKHVYLAGHFVVPDSSLKRVKAVLPEHIELTRAEAGCLRFEVTQDSHDETKFHMVEVFKSRAAFNAHQDRTGRSEWAEVSRDCPRDYVMAGAP